MNILSHRIESAATVEPRQADRIRSVLHHLGVVVPILIVYFCLAFYQIGHQSLWVDEVISVQVATEESFFSPVIWFRQSPLYFALLHLWVQLGTSETILRFLSVIFGGVAVCLTYVLGSRLFNRRVACIGATIFATSPFLIWYSQEVRYITLMIVTALLSMYAFHRGLASNRREWWISYCCSLVVATGAFVSNVLLPFVQGLFVFWSPSRRHFLRKVLISQVLLFSVFFWWGNGGQFSGLGGRWEKLFTHITASSDELSSVPRTERLSSGGNREFEWAAIPYTFFTFSTGFSMGPSVRELQVSTRSVTTLKPYTALIGALGVLFGVLFATGLISTWRERDNGILAIAWVVVPIMGASVISALTDMAYNVRYVAMAVPAYVLLLSAGIVSFRPRVVQISLVASVVLVNVLSLSNYYFNPRYAREDTRSAARYLEAAVDSGDMILVVGSPTALRHYYTGRVPMVTWSDKDNSDQSVLGKRSEKLARNYKRIWMVETRRWQSDPNGMVKTTLERLYPVVRYQNFPGVQMTLYDLQSHLT